MTREESVLCVRALSRLYTEYMQIVESNRGPHGSKSIAETTKAEAKKIDDLLCRWRHPEE